MGFVYEKVPEDDLEFLKSMKLKDCWGEKLLYVDEETKWCADRERNAYLIGVGGGYHDMPYFYDLWWKGYVIRLEISKRAKTNVEGGVDIVWYIHKISVSNKIWKYKDEVIEMINEAFSINRVWYEMREVRSITVKIRCEAEKVVGK